MANPTPPDPDVVAEAYRLTQPAPLGEDMSLAQVALRLGVSKTTAGEYVRRAITHLPLVDLVKRAKQQGDMAHRLATVVVEAYELAAERKPRKREEPVDEWVMLQDFATKKEAQLAVLLGLNAPKALDISTNGNGNGRVELKDRSLIEALAKLDERDAADDRALRAGGPGVIEGGSTQ